MGWDGLAAIAGPHREQREQRASNQRVAHRHRTLALTRTHTYTHRQMRADCSSTPPAPSGRMGAPLARRRPPLRSYEKKTKKTLQNKTTRKKRSKSPQQREFQGNKRGQKGPKQKRRKNEAQKGRARGTAAEHAQMQQRQEVGRRSRPRECERESNQCARQSSAAKRMLRAGVERVNKLRMGMSIVGDGWGHQSYDAPSSPGTVTAKARLVGAERAEGDAKARSPSSFIWEAEHFSSCLFTWTWPWPW